MADPEVAHYDKLRAIRAITISIDTVRAKFKYGGNVDDDHRKSVIARLKGAERSRGQGRRRPCDSQEPVGTSACRPHRTGWTGQPLQGVGAYQGEDRPGVGAFAAQRGGGRVGTSGGHLAQFGRRPADGGDGRLLGYEVPLLATG